MAVFIKYHTHMKNSLWLAGLCLVASTLVTAQDVGKGQPPQNPTPYPQAYIYSYSKHVSSISHALERRTFASIPCRGLLYFDRH
jgi:hypothetical protein